MNGDLWKLLLEELTPDDEDEADDRPLRRCLGCLWRGRTEGEACPLCGMRLEKKAEGR